MMDPSWSNFNHHLPHLSTSKLTSSDKSKNNHSTMANFPAIPSTAFSRSDASLAGFPQNLLLHSSGTHGSPNDAFMNSASTEFLKAGYGTAATLLSYTGVAASQPNLTHSSLFNSFQPKDSERNELCDSFPRSLHSLSMLATSSQSQIFSRNNSDPFSTTLQAPGSSRAWHLPSPSLTSSMFGVLPHESVGSKASEKSRSAKSKSYAAASSAHTTTAGNSTGSKTSTFVYGTSPSAGTTAKTVLSSNLLSSPTYLPQSQYNSFLSLSDKKDNYDQNNSALDYTSGNNATTNSIKSTLDSDIQKSTKCDSDHSHQSPMMACQSPAANHHSPMVSSAVISPVEPSVYSPASSLKYSDHNFEGGTENNQRKFPPANSSSASHCSSHMSIDLAKAHPSPHNSSVCANSPLNSSTAGSPFISESPRESGASAKDFHCVNSELPSTNYDPQHSVLSPTSCNLSSEDNYDLITQRAVASTTALDPVFNEPDNIDELTLHELSKFTGTDSTKMNNIAPNNASNSKLHNTNNLLMNNRPVSTDRTGSQRIESSSYQQVQLTDMNTGKVKSANISSSASDVGMISPDDHLKINKENLQNLNPGTIDPLGIGFDHNSDTSNPSPSEVADDNSSLENHFSSASGKPAGFFNSYLSFIKNSSPPSKVKRKRGRPRKESDSDALPNPFIPIFPLKQEKVKSDSMSESFTFSDSEEEQDTNHNISDTVQLALNSLTDDNIEKGLDQNFNENEEKSDVKDVKIFNEDKNKNLDQNPSKDMDKNTIKSPTENNLNMPKVVPKRKIYENCVDSNNAAEKVKREDVYDFDDFENFEAEPSPTGFKTHSHSKKKSFRKNSPGRSQSKAAPGGTADDAVRRLSMRKCVEKLVQKREQRIAEKKSAKQRVESSSDTDDDSDDDWTPGSKCVAVIPNESDKSDNSEPEGDNEIKLIIPPTKHKKVNKYEPVKKKARMHRNQDSAIDEDSARPCALKSGDFIINIKDMYKEKPYAIWRIHGRNSIQKYESFDKEDKVLYHRIATYIDWNSDNSHEFIPVNIRFNYSQRGNCVVEYLGPVRTDPKFMNQMMMEGSQFQAQKENFEVYLQTLISQALDPNFISEIVKEMDEYFLSHMRQIDDMAITRKEKLIKNKNWKDAFIQSVQYYPCVNIITSKSLQDGPCQACDSSVCVKLVQFYGQPYDYTTLRRTELSPQSYISGNKTYSTCENCSELVSLYNRLHHQKYNFYIACHTKVNRVRISSRVRLESHVILEKSLGDADWINKMFEEIMLLWLECDRTR